MNATTKSHRRTLTSLAALFLLAGCADTALHQTQTFDAPVHTVEIDVDAGDVEILADDSAGTEVTVSFDCDGQVPGFDLNLDDGVLTLSMRAGAAAASCEGDFSLTVPTGVDAKVRAWNGDVSVTGLRGELTASTLNGTLVVDDVRGDALELTAVSGSVLGTDLQADRLAARTGAGDVDLVLLTDPQQVTVEVILGNAQVQVPGDTFRIQAEAPEGTVVLDHVQHSDSAPQVIRAAAKAGDITISGR